MIGNIIKFIFIVTLVVCIIVQITSNPLNKCENPKCDVCPFPDCNKEEVEDKWSENYDDKLQVKEFKFYDI